MSVIRGIETVDALTLNLISSAKEIGEATRHGDRFGFAQASAEHTKGYLEGTHYLATATEKGTTLAILCSKYFPFTVDEKVVHILEQLTAGQTVAGIGVAISSLIIIVNSISIHRQNEVLSVIPDKAALKNDNILSETIEALQKVNYNHFRKALPDHLKAKIDSYGGEHSFEYFKDEIKDGRPNTAKIIVSDIKDFADRKRVVHILALMGGIVSLVASIGLFVAFPPLALTILAIVGLALTVTCVLMSKGWVENTKEGFNWKLCLPEFIQKKLTIDKEFISEMTEFEQASVREGITPTVQILEMKAAPKNKNIFIESVVNDDDAIAFRTLLPLNPEKKPTFWEKLQGKFLKKEANIEAATPKIAPPAVKSAEVTSMETNKGDALHPLADIEAVDKSIQVKTIQLETHKTLTSRESTAKQGIHPVDTRQLPPLFD